MHFHFKTPMVVRGLALAAILAVWPLALTAQSVQTGNALVSQSPLQPSPRLSETIAPGPDSDSVISADDVLDISVMDVPEFSRQYRISPAGTVLLPLLSQPLKAAEMKVTDFSDLVARNLRDEGFVSDAHVVVSIASSRLKSVAITGAVKKPQIYPVFGRTTLLDLLSQAEGLSEDAGNTAVISRGEIGARSVRAVMGTETVDLKQLLESGDAAFNIAIYPGDRVTVPKAGIVYVLGAVNKPGGFIMKPSKQGMTVMNAVALAEDLKSTARRNNAVVIRVDVQAPGGRKQIPVDLKKILASKAPDPVLQADDILFVPDSPGKKAFTRGLEAALQTTTGLAIYRF
jgi:polysaccharide export outer membrane protein